MSYFSYPAAFTMGNVGRNTFDRQRSIDTQFAFQNPFKWYNLSAPNTSVNFTTGTSDEGTTANAGGQGLRNITLQFRF
ncbi:MAG: hypothetical protein HY820_25275 [Acidobacteria bacterium]|nr:hypothetical protein [Acidobacteriota bacterium]